MNILEDLRTNFNCDVAELAEVANVCPATIYRWQSTRQIPGYGFHALKRFKDELAEMSQPEPEPPPAPVKTAKGTPITFEQLELALCRVEANTAPPKFRKLLEQLIKELRIERGVVVEVTCDGRRP